MNSSKHMESTNKKLFILGSIIIALIAAVLIWSAVDREGEPGELNYTYASDDYGFSFVYPDRYTLQESYVGDPQSPRNAITITEKSGAGQIKVEVFSNTLSQTPVEAWIRQSSASRFDPNSSQLVRRTVDGTNAYMYTPGGESAGKVTVFEHKGNIIAVSSDFTTQDEGLNGDYDSLILSIELN